MSCSFCDCTKAASWSDERSCRLGGGIGKIGRVTRFTLDFACCIGSAGLDSNSEAFVAFSIVTAGFADVVSCLEVSIMKRPGPGDIRLLAGEAVFRPLERCVVEREDRTSSVGRESVRRLLRNLEPIVSIGSSITL